tara:strand:- start:269 stop:517 length:249 start_codon:yes stop_codon:yes gene_type:complete
MKITKSQLKQIIKEELNEVGQDLSLKDTIGQRSSAAAAALSNISMFVEPLLQTGNAEDKELAEMVKNVEWTLQQILTMLDVH